MKVIVAGSRSITDYEVVAFTIEASGFEITELVSGHQPGAVKQNEWLPTVDLLGERWAMKHKVPITSFKADWKTYGNSAGIRRNIEMAKYAQAAIVVWDGTSRGSRHMLDIAIRTFGPEWVYVYNPIRHSRLRTELWTSGRRVWVKLSAQLPLFDTQTALETTQS